MSGQALTFYRLVCDTPREHRPRGCMMFTDGPGDLPFDDARQAERWALAHGWAMREGGGHACPNCLRAGVSARRPPSAPAKAARD